MLEPADAERAKTPDAITQTTIITGGVWTEQVFGPDGKAIPGVVGTYWVDEKGHDNDGVQRLYTVFEGGRVTIQSTKYSLPPNEKDARVFQMPVTETLQGVTATPIVKNAHDNNGGPPIASLELIVPIKPILATPAQPPR